METIINGKRVILPDNAKVRDAKSVLPETRSDQFIISDQQGTRELSDNDFLVKGSKIFSIPPIVKGQPMLCLEKTPQPPLIKKSWQSSRRIQEEMGLLQQAVGVRSPLSSGPITVSGQEYTGVIVKDIRLNHPKFNITRCNLLFLIPQVYPAIPPIGCYLNYNFDINDSHFTQRGYHDAPNLVDKGWHWYCVGLGGGFNQKSSSHWKPGGSASNGHNLVTLFAAATYALNTSD
ncbi:MAG: hypothetical protein HQM12_04290 [SAR324 cluster bacterium]|nr:hypothetical protein [SAR324 cluster bacterium]